MHHNDILTVSIGTPEHGGRVRGFSGWTGIKDAFGKVSRRPTHAGCLNHADVTRMIREALEAQAQTFHQQMEEMLQGANVIVPVNHCSPQQSRLQTEVGSNSGSTSRPPVDNNRCVLSKVLLSF